MNEYRLDSTSRRILGVLIEKQITTPNLYPLSLNALCNGCNQKNNRFPETAFEEFEVDGALRQLQEEAWVTNFAEAGSRTQKWKQRFAEKTGLEGADLAVVCELLLRGPQQPGALRSRCDRLHPIRTRDALMEVIAKLEALGLVHWIPPGPGERSRRLDHRFYLENEGAEESLASSTSPQSNVQVATETRAGISEIQELLAKIEALEERCMDYEVRLAKLEAAE